jgi:hypothetical protein
MWLGDFRPTRRASVERTGLSVAAYGAMIQGTQELLFFVYFSFFDQSIAGKVLLFCYNPITYKFLNNPDQFLWVQLVLYEQISILNSSAIVLNESLNVELDRHPSSLQPLIPGTMKQVRVAGIPPGDALVSSKLVLPPLNVRMNEIRRVICPQYIVDPCQGFIRRVTVNPIPSASPCNPEQKNRHHCICKVFGDLSRNM